MRTGSDSPAELGRAVDARVDLAAQPLLGFSNRRGDDLQANVADDQQVHVASGILCCAGHRAVYECYPYALLDGPEGFAKLVDQSGGLGEEAPEFGENWRVRIRPIIHAVALAFGEQDLGLRQPSKLALEGRMMHS